MELDIQGAQLGVKPCVLDGHQISWLTGLVMVRVPPAWGSYKGSAGLPGDFYWIDQVSILIDFFGDCGIAARFAGDDQVKGDGFVCVRELISTDWQDSEHSPEDMRDGECLREMGVGQQYTDTAALRGKWIRGSLGQGRLGFLFCVEGWFEAWFGCTDPEVGEQWLIVDPVQDAIGVGR